MPESWLSPIFNCVKSSYPTIARRTLLPLRATFPSTSKPASIETVTNLPSDVLIEEETTPTYDPKHYYPVNPGELFHDRYETLAKLGWGSSSTVWLARDIRRWRWQSSRYVALKINNCDFGDRDATAHELNIEKHISKKNPMHEGFDYIRTFSEHFEAVGPNGTHLCLVYDPMREPLWLLRQRCKDRKFPLGLLKGYLQLLLKGLDYLHSDCHVIHTDLKVDNILVGFENASVIEDFVKSQANNPMPRKTADGRFIYLSHNNFGKLKSFYILPKISDFGLAQLQEDIPQPQRHPIQPDHYRAPEVILGAGWTYSVDIWNLGVLIWNLLENDDLFHQIYNDRGEYIAQAHLAEMIALLGPPPLELLNRERDGLKWNWAPAVENSAGKLCTKACEWYGGPFFDDKGEFIHKHLIPAHRNLEDTIPSLQGEDKRLYLAFVKKMLQWLPEDRKTAKELLADPWLSDKSIKKDWA